MISPKSLTIDLFGEYYVNISKTIGILLIIS